MPITDDYAEIPAERITIKRDTRQRKHIDVSDLVESIQLHGVLNPVIVTRELVLVAGERRTAACKQLNLPVPVRFLDSLDEIELQLIELEENVKRSDLTWRDHVAAVGRIHQLYSSCNPTWTHEKTASAIGVTRGSITQILRVFKDLDSPAIASASGFMAAYNILSRTDARAGADVLSEILEFDPSAGAAEGSPVPAEGSPVVGIEGLPVPAEGSPVARAEGPPVTRAEGPSSILQADFMTWAPAYTGPKFSFIHCDFPYGLDVFAGKRMRLSGFEPYDDSPELFTNLISCLCENLHRIMKPSGHLMFWFPMQRYTLVYDMFKKLAPQLVLHPIPLIWVKSDNIGIAPDPRRGPRQIYETALFGYCGDLPIVRVVSNVFSHPTDKELHPSTKPEPMLRHFFQMFVDSSTSMLDPTCGSGAALRAAEALGAKNVLGLEIDPVHVSNARSALRRARLG